METFFKKIRKTGLANIALILLARLRYRIHSVRFLKLKSRSLGDVMEPRQFVDVRFSAPSMGIETRRIGIVGTLPEVYYDTLLKTLFLKSPNTRTTIVFQTPCADPKSALNTSAAPSLKLLELNGAGVATAEPVRSNRHIYILDAPSSYMLFLYESLPQLLLVLQRFGNGVDIHLIGRPADYILFLLQVCEKIYDCRIVRVERASRFLHFTTSCVFCSGTQLRYLRDAPYFHDIMVRLLREQFLAIEGEEIEDVSAAADDYWSSPKLWRIKTRSGRELVLRNDNVDYMLSHAEADAMSLLVDELRRRVNHDSSQRRIVLVDREGSTRKGRTIANQTELLRRFPEIQPVKFGVMPFSDQLKICLETDILIAVIGAGLANTIFARPGSSLVVIHPAKLFIPHNFAGEFIADAYDRRLYNFYSSSRNAQGGTTIDLDQFEVLLNKVKRTIG